MSRRNQPRSRPLDLNRVRAYCLNEVVHFLTSSLGKRERILKIRKGRDVTFLIRKLTWMTKIIEKKPPVCNQEPYWQQENSSDLWKRMEGREGAKEKIKRATAEGMAC